MNAADAFPIGNINLAQKSDFSFSFSFPYSTDFGRRECCGGQTFLNDKKCCIRNKVQECKNKPGPYGGR